LTAWLRMMNIASRRCKASLLPQPCQGRMSASECLVRLNNITTEFLDACGGLRNRLNCLA
jgi:hypothetical protein